MGNDRCIVRIEGSFDGAITRIRFAPQSNNILVSSWDSTLRLCNAETSQITLEVPCGSPLLDSCFEDDVVALSVGTDCSVRRYDLHSGDNSIIGNHDDLGHCIEYSKETSDSAYSVGILLHGGFPLPVVLRGSTRVITAGFDKQLMFWDSHKSSCSGTYSKGLDVEADSMSLSGFNLFVAFGTTICVYDLRTMECPVQSYECPVKYHARCIRSAPNSRGYAVGTVGGSVTLNFFNDPTDGFEASAKYTFWCSRKSKIGRHHVVPVNAIVFHPRDTSFITGDYEGHAIIWDSESQRRLFEFPKCPSSISSLSLNYEAELLAIASSYTCQEANQMELPPQIFLCNVGDCLDKQCGY